MKKYLLCLSLLLSTVLTFADGLKGRRVLFLLDGSSSMSVPYEKGQTRFQKAAATILSIMDSISAKEKNVEFALRVYGHQYPAQEKNCFDSKIEVPFSKGNRAQMELRLESLKPIGISPLSYAIQEAILNDLRDGFSYSVFIISDGDESCGRDICEDAKQVKAKCGSRPAFINLGSDNEKIKSLPCLQYKSLNVNYTISNARELDTPKISVNAKQSDDDSSTGYILLKGISNPKALMVYQKRNGINTMPSNLDIDQLRQGVQVKVKTGNYTIEYLSHDKRIKSTVIKVVRGMITSLSLF